MKMIEEFIQDPEWYPAALVSKMGDKDAGPVVAELGHMGRLGLVKTKEDQRYLYQWALNDPYHKIRVAQLESKMSDAERRIEHLQALNSNKYLVRTFALLLRVHEYMSQSFISTALDQELFQTRAQLTQLVRAGLAWPTVGIEGSRGPLWQVRGLTEREVEDAEHTFAEILDVLPKVIAERELLLRGGGSNGSTTTYTYDERDLRAMWARERSAIRARRVLTDLNATDEENQDLYLHPDIDFLDKAREDEFGLEEFEGEIRRGGWVTKYSKGRQRMRFYDVR